MKYQEFQNVTLNDLINTQASRYAHRPFLSLEGKRWTYAEIYDQASTLASSLWELGLRSGDRLAVILPNVPKYVVTLFAAAQAGLILVPVNPHLHPKEILSRLSRTRPKAIITFSAEDKFDGVDHLSTVKVFRGDLTDLIHVINTNPFSYVSQGSRVAVDVISWYELLLSSTKKLSCQSLPLDPAVIIHTLGSSGETRGVVLAHQGLVRNAAGIAEHLSLTSDDVILGAVPFSDAFGLTATILAGCIAGAQLACLPQYNPVDALQLIKAASVTIHHGTPIVFATEIHHPDFDPETCSSLRTGIISGAPCPQEIINLVREKMGFQPILAYGLTEASYFVTMTCMGSGSETANESAGRPMEGVQLKIIDPKGKPLPFGKEGELCVRGYNVMLEYWEDAIATAKVLDADGWLHTGDIAIIDQDESIRILGRIYDVINRGGNKIYPDAVEIVLSLYPGVNEVVLVGIPDMIYGEQACACVVRAPEAKFSAVEIMAYAAQHLADYSLPDRVLFFETLPRKLSGLVDKEILRERVRIRGLAWKFGRNVDTDAIIPARRCNTTDPRELAQYCMEDADPKFVNKMRRGDLIVAESNFGCGSSREVAPLTIKAAGVSAVIATSFARIFFRNAINIGLPIFECPEAVNGIKEGDEVEVEPVAGIIRNLTRGEIYRSEPFPDFLQRIIDRGGLLAYVEERLAEL